MSVVILERLSFMHGLLIWLKCVNCVYVCMCILIRLKSVNEQNEWMWVCVCVTVFEMEKRLLMATHYGSHENVAKTSPFECNVAYNICRNKWNGTLVGTWYIREKKEKTQSFAINWLANAKDLAIPTANSF